MPELDNVLPNDPIETVWGNAIRDRTIQRYTDRPTRSSEHGSPVNGDLSYLLNEKVLEFYDGAAWVGFLPAGTIVATGRSTAPSGWVLCQGQAVSRTTFATLFSAIGTTYGNGDGSTTFNVPNLQQRFPLGKASSGTGQTLGGTGGSINHVHTGPNHNHSNPSTNAGGSHSHSQTPTGGTSLLTGTANVGSTVLRASGAANTLAADHTHSISSHTHSNPNTAAGGSHSHSQGNTGNAGTGNTGQGNPPFLVVNYMIKH